MAEISVPSLQCVVHMLEGEHEDADTVWQGYALCQVCVGEIERAPDDGYGISRRITVVRQEIRRQVDWRKGLRRGRD